MDDDKRDLTTPQERPDQGTQPPSNPPRDEDAVRKGEDKLKQAGAGH